MVLRNSGKKEFTCIWQSKWVGVIAIEIEKKTQLIHFLSDVFVARRRRGILNSLFIRPRKTETLLETINTIMNMFPTIIKTI